MNELARITFDDHVLTFLRHKGRICVPARALGAALGMSHGGKRLPNKIAREWSEDFVEGVDYDVLRGEELEVVRSELERGTDPVPLPGRGSLMVLYESGVHLVLVKSRTEKGRRLRRILADDVLPQLSRDGRFDPSRSVVNGELVGPVLGETLPERRETRLERQAEIRSREVDLRDRRFQVATLQRTIDNLRTRGLLSAPAVAALEVSASEIALQRPLDHLKPRLSAADWLSPSAMATRWRVTAQRVGRTITKLDLRRERPGLAVSILNTAKGSSRQVVTWLYSPEAVELIRVELVIAGYIPTDEE